MAETWFPLWFLLAALKSLAEASAPSCCCSSAQSQELLLGNSTTTSHSGCQCPRRCQWLLKWCDPKSRKHEMCHFFLVCSAPWITREANEHEIANALQDLPFQRCWFLFSSLCASTHHNKFRLGIETSSWKMCLGLHNLHTDTSSKILVQGTPQSAAEI